MRPERLSLEGFCSFTDPVDVDLSGVRTAAIVGPNGAGKTSLLDAMVFALYGQPRVPGDVDSVVASTAERAVVALTFTTCDGARWQVTRTRQRRTRRSTAMLEAEDPAASSGWRLVTSGGVRDTDMALVELLGASLDTFTATTFSAQGDLDRFTAAPPAQRRHHQQPARATRPRPYSLAVPESWRRWPASARAPPDDVRQLPADRLPLGRLSPRSLDGWASPPGPPPAELPKIAGHSKPFDRSACNPKPTRLRAQDGERAID